MGLKDIITNLKKMNEPKKKKGKKKDSKKSKKKSGKKKEKTEIKSEEMTVLDRDGTPICPACKRVTRFKGHRIEMVKGVRTKNKQFYCPSCKTMIKIPLRA